MLHTHSFVYHRRCIFLTTELLNDTNAAEEWVGPSQNRSMPYGKDRKFRCQLDPPHSQVTTLTVLPGSLFHIQPIVIPLIYLTPWSNTFRVSFLGLKRQGRGGDHAPYLAPTLKKE
jgi:hypothetical protein